MSRKSPPNNRTGAENNNDSSQIISLFDSPPADRTAEHDHSSRVSNFRSNWRRRLLYPGAGILLAALLVIGVMGKNGWLPSTDSVSGKKTGWFGKELSANAASSWNPMAPPLPSATPQLSKEYIYAGSRMLAVEDAGANAAPPTDLAVWRPANGGWYVLNSSNGQLSSATFGAASDEPVQGDYDGDGKTDFAVYRRNSDGAGNAAWYISMTSTGAFYGIQFGSSSDTPVAADFDGDGKTDVAVYRPLTGGWYIYRSSDQTVSGFTWGNNSYEPIPKDYDGDGLADYGLWSGNTMYALRSSDNQYQSYSFPSPTSSYVPVPADYDGDGKSDFAVKDGTNWIIRQSSDNTIQTIACAPWMQATDKAVPNDYDADGRVDIAVWRESTGMWYIRQSSRIGQSNELRQTQWGQQYDVPVPSFYRR